MSDAKASDAPTPASGGSKLVPAMLVINTVLMGGVIFMVMKKPATPAAVAAPSAGGGEHRASGKAAAPGAPGVMVKLENFVIQLKAIDTEKYVRVAFDLEVASEEGKTAVVANTSRIRDTIISYFLDRTVEELRGSESLERTKAALLKRFSTITSGEHIKAVYITDFIVQ